MHFIVIGILCIIYLYKMRRFLNWWFILGLSVFYCCMYYGLYPKADSIDQNVVVIAVDNLDTYNRYTVLSIQGKYHLNHQVTYHVGDIINIQGELEVYRQQTIPGRSEEHTS